MAHQSKHHVPEADVQIFPFFFRYILIFALKNHFWNATFVSDQHLWLDLFYPGGYISYKLLSGSRVPRFSEKGVNFQEIPRTYI